MRIINRAAKMSSLKGKVQNQKVSSMSVKYYESYEEFKEENNKAGDKYSNKQHTNTHTFILQNKIHRMVQRD